MKIQEAKERYRPEKVKYLFISEASPVVESFRHFYYAYAEGKDDLFLNMMMALYPVTYKSYLPATELRKSKKTFLEMFRDSGCVLIDSVPNPFPMDINRSLRINIIKENREVLLKEINEICDDKTKVILISATVYAACNDFLLENNVNVVNVTSISFPDRWHKDNFQRQIAETLNHIGWFKKKKTGNKSVTIIKK